MPPFLGTKSISQLFIPNINVCFIFSCLLYLLLILLQFVLKLVSQLSWLCPSTSFRVLDAPADWEQSGTGSESIYASHLLSIEAAAGTQHEQVGATLSCRHCLSSGSNGGRFMFMAQGERKTQKYSLTE